MIEGAKNKRRFVVKKIVVIVLAVMMVAAVGCKKSEETKKAAAPQTPATAAQPVVPPAVQPAAQTPAAPQTPAAMQAPTAPPAGGDPHAGLKLKEMAAGTGHKGKVLQTMDAGSYTYVEVEEKGQKIWVAAIKVKVAKGDTVEFPDSKPILNFESKTLKRTFDKIIFAETLRVVK